jgi:NAD+ diphosphatase
MLNLAFVASPLDRNANNRTKFDFLASCRSSSKAKILQLAGDAVRLENDHLFTTEEAPEAEAIFLGLDGANVPWFARHVAFEEHFKSLRSLMLEGALPEAELAILAQARSLLHWHESHKFCAKCGQQSLMADAGYRRNCAGCGTDHFPRTDPVVIMAVCHGSRILLGRQASWQPGMFSALAGFMEPGETIEQAVRREVLEEAGIMVGHVTYVQSQPWPFPSSLMIGVIGQAQNTEIKLDPQELEQARWFERSEVVQMLDQTHPEGLIASHPYAIAHHIVKAALEN